MAILTVVLAIFAVFFATMAYAKSLNIKKNDKATKDLKAYVENQLLLEGAPEWMITEFRERPLTGWLKMHRALKSSTTTSGITLHSNTSSEN